MELLTSRSPEAMRPAVAMSVFPPLGAHLQGVKLTYWDGRDYEPAFMQVVAAEMSVGKSAVNLPIDYIIADIEARDDVARHKDAEWKERCATLKTTEDKPTRPKGLAVQVLSADMTNAAFVQRLADAEGKFLYTQMDEIELLDSLKANTRGGAVSAILRLAFDCGKYGQERVASNAINAKVRVRWNWNASTTIQRVRKYFAPSIADGTLSRLSFATIIKDDDDWGEQRPRFSAYGKPFADALAPYIDRRYLEAPSSGRGEPPLLFEAMASGSWPKCTTPTEMSAAPYASSARRCTSRAACGMQWWPWDTSPTRRSSRGDR